MFYPHHSSSQQAGGAASASKHHDGNGDPSRLGGGGGWGRHPSFTPGGMPMPSPGGYPGLGGGYGAPPGPGPGAGHQHHVHGHGLHGHGQHHPSFGSGAGAGGLHLGGAQNGGMGAHGPAGYGGLGMFGSGAGGGQQNSPPRGAAEPSVPMTPFWSHQVSRAEVSRQAGTPHHRARAAAISSRATIKPSAVTITDPNNRPNSSQANGVHRKNTSSLSVVNSAADRAITPPLSEATTTPATSNGEPVSLQPPAPNDKEENAESEPWTGLDLGGIHLKTLSRALFAFTHITSLYINHNALTVLPAAISNLRQLTVLDATSNQIASIPPELGVLSKLKELLLFDNQLTTLPHELGTLYQLETLGIDGNPLMNEQYRNILAEGGTTALIVHLRDGMPLGPEPPKREWIEIEPDVSSPSSGQQESFTVLSYNILCPSFAPGTTYSYTPAWALSWSWRKEQILKEIVGAAADVVCLQEIDGQQYSEYFYPQLKQHGYEGSHYARSRARTMSSDEAKLVDGCATFWKLDRFQLVETQVVEFNQVALQKIDMRTDDMFNRVMSRDNIAVVASLEFVASGARLMVANSHIYWDHRYRDVKLVQTGMLMEELEKIVERFAHLPAKLSSDPEYNNGQVPTYDRLEKGRDIPLVMCVDLNSLAASAVYDFLSTGELAPDHEDFMSHAYGPYTAKGLKHRLGLRSSSASIGEMRMTNFTPTFDAAIDYIFYTPRSLKVTSVLGDVERSYLDTVVGFPNPHFPSDHIPVFAQFRIRGTSDSSQSGMGTGTNGYNR